MRSAIVADHALSSTASTAPAPAAEHGGSLVAMGRVVERDLRSAWRRPAETGAVLAFLAIVASLFPLAIGSEPALLRRIAPGVLWVAALLATMLSLPRLFADDQRDGTLEQLLLSPTPLPLLVAAKALAHWLRTGLPLALLSPLLALQFGLPIDAIGALFAALLAGTPVLSLVGATGAALMVAARGGGALLALLLLPLTVPVLVFGAGAVDAAAAALPIRAHLSLLGALLCLAAFLAPPAAAAALRIAVE